jgi:hypothetical protein
LHRLLHDLDHVAWDCNNGEGAGVHYERLPVGSGVGGGMGGAVVRDGVWVHNEFVELGMADVIADVIEGRRQERSTTSLFPRR